MPTYEFKCPKCSEVTETNCEYEDLTVPVCEECGTLMIRTYSPPGIHFKGSGFYSTDKEKS